MPAPRTAPTMTTLILLSGASILTLNMILPSLPAIASHFGVSYAAAGLTISAYLLATAALQLVAGPLSDLFGRRPVALGSIMVFVAASAGCLLATDFATFLACRIVQAAIISAGVVARAVVRDTSDGSDATAKMGTIGMAIAIGPMIAPAIGGVIDGLFGWRASFSAFLAIGIGLLVWTWSDMGETNARRGRPPSETFRALPVLATSGLFWSYTLCMGLSVGVFFAFVTGLPLVAEERFGLSPFLLGLALGAPPVGFLIGNALSRRLAGSVRTGALILWGRAVTLAGMGAALLVWLLGATDAIWLVVFMPLIGLGNGLTFPAGLVGAMSIRPDLAGAAAGLNGAAMFGIGALATWMTSAALTLAAGPVTLLALLVALAGAALLAGLPAIRHGARPKAVPA